MRGRRARPSPAAVWVVVAAVSAGVVAGVACTPRGGATRARPVASATTVPIVDRAPAEAREAGVGGSVRAAVWGDPDPAAPTLAGAAVRSLVLPQLFRAMPDGRWSPWLVEPGSDRDGPASESASFRLLAGAAWSDGSAITAADLRRTADARFVAGVDGPGADGTLTVRFTAPLPGWRRLWSGVDSVAAPRDGVWGGPFVVTSRVPGLETVLARNPAWVGEGPHLAEVRLVLVPDATMARQLLARGEVDVVAPPAGTRRAALLGAVDGVEVASRAAPVGRGGWWVGLFLNPAELPLERRRALVASVDRRRFVDVLLGEGEEAARLDGFTTGGGGGPARGAWSEVEVAEVAAASDAFAPLADAVVDVVGQIEEPMTGLLHRSMQRRLKPVGARLELRQTEADRAEGWVAAGDHGAAVLMAYDGPEVCWRCRWDAVDATLATAADGGSTEAAATLESKLRDDALLLPLWTPKAVVAWREAAVAGVRANPYGLSSAFDAWRWYAS